MLKFAIHTLGCKVNQYESERIAGEFLRQGFKFVDFTELADIYIINTCMVTNATEAKSRKIIRRATRKNPQSLIVVTGCYAELKPDDINLIEHVNLVVKNSEKSNLVHLVTEALSVSNTVKKSELSEKVNFRTRALVKIQDGCNQFCSYCIIPYARGALKSRSLREVVSEVEELVDMGTKEVVLTGIHLGKYGQDIQEEGLLEKLLLKLNDIEGLKKIRLSSIEPKEITPNLISLMSSKPKICRHFHIPLQSGSDKILRSMNRNYTAEDFNKVVRQIKSLIPEVAITTDVIVGFPGETEECFQQTVSVIEKISFRKLHVFRFSPRSGTKAAEMDCKILDSIKESRSRKLIKIGEMLADNFLNQFLGRELDVLVEKFNDKKLLMGHTDNYIKVNFEGSDILRGQIVSVRALEVQNGEIFGKIVDGNTNNTFSVVN
ncbi:tRNA (N(6)-L-threonylcarbamoyladenosine(37)-C(2))-methylthiotransferase MtaB [Candidatus Oleimmundimicrobium sp.]|uniref:tRNA (N(6)-L-threonylcarbamoyladenosine(37)-C(2))- methylthiotransferase MtaB n=1 Tax=Candidatus Oleimmundimicrobium sp. TaxID=3060597 RepID=UPI002717B805|nr:tRNA (N(6)-L-threonylcarbamoyladenosine(37)-C(2))-methylthiotransferase MtaB [Candidatus Oleimmundimicrobium sp.]MDO8885849.1 tRNA (N(6)-L-threonylcarbamoyladenosine(37)-C(2))-methylthiotransferase MtaB [Candidatus Oleimmundimicrobium sp.]